MMMVMQSTGKIIMFITFSKVCRLQITKRLRRCVYERWSEELAAIQIPDKWKRNDEKYVRIHVRFDW